MRNVIKNERVKHMFKSKKFSFTLAIIFVLTIFFSQGAIASDNNPFSKTSNLNSLESKISLNMKLSGTNLSKDEEVAMLEVTKVLSNLDINLNTKTINNADKTKSEGYVNMGINLPGMPMNMEMWVKSDISNGKPIFSETIKLPQNLTSLTNGALKDYIVIDSAQLNSVTPAVIMPSIDSKKLTESSKKIMEALSKVLEGYKSNFNFESDKGSVIVATPEGNVNAHAYQIKLDDSGVKALLKYAVKNASENNELLVTLKDLVKDLKLTNNTDNVDEQFKGALDGFNKVLDSLKDVKIIGDKGIVLNYAVNTDGYIVSEDGTIDLTFNVPKLMEVINKLDPSQSTTMSNTLTGIYNLSIDFKSVNYSINKDMKIDYPVLTPENSMNLMDLVGSVAGNIQGLQNSTPANVKVTPVKTKVTPPNIKAAPVKAKVALVKAKVTPSKTKITPVKSKVTSTKNKKKIIKSKKPDLAKKGKIIKKSK